MICWSYSWILYFSAKDIYSCLYKLFCCIFTASLSNVDILRVTIYSPILQAGNIKGKGKNPPKCNILDYWVFDYSILVREPLKKPYKASKPVFQLTIIYVELWIIYGKLPISFEESFKVTSLLFFVPDFSLLSWELYNLHLKCYIVSSCINIVLKQNINYNTAQFLVKWFLLLLQ